MRLTFLSANIPLTKTFAWSARDERFTTSPYPHVAKVTSEEYEAATLDDFARLLTEQGRFGRCLLKGKLDRPLVNESRASHAPSADYQHDWIVFDFDRVDCPPTFEGAETAIRKYLPACCHDVSAVIQLSASAFRPDTRKLSCHVFMQLAFTMTTQQLTDWFTTINFTEPLASELTLSDSGMALRFPLDRTVSSPAKLIYIAPPRCIGFEPRLQHAVAISDQSKSALVIPPFERLPYARTAEKIDELRARAQLPERAFKTRTAHGLEIVVDAEPCVIHDIRPSGEGYIRFNMNGGDSLAYFINVKEPALVGNFKGEPYLHTAQVAPELFKSLVKTAKSTPIKMLPAEIEPLAFYATNRASNIYIGTYNRANNELRVDQSTGQAAASWMASFGLPKVSSLPHYDLVYDMTSDLRYEDGYPIINLAKQSPYMVEYGKMAQDLPCETASLAVFTDTCPTLYKLVMSAVGSEPVAAWYFINWLAAIFRLRDRTTSAWVLHGTQGTGKGLIVHHLLKPLYGEEAVTQQLFSALNSEFNAYVEGKLVVVYDETALSRSQDWAAVRTRLYDWITEPTVSIRAMRTDHRSVPNRANFILCSNDMRPVVIEHGDRRFNVGEYQSQRLLLSPAEVACILTHKEVPAFAQLLGRWHINEEMLIKPYGGAAKQRVMEATRSLVDSVGIAIKEGDVQFFYDNRPDELQLRVDFPTVLFPMREYDELLKHMVTGKLNVMQASDFYVLFRVVTLNDKLFPESRAAQRRVYQRYGFLETESVRDKRTGDVVRGWRTGDWHISPTLREAVLKLARFERPTNNVTPIKRKE